MITKFKQFFNLNKIMSYIFSWRLPAVFFVLFCTVLAIALIHGIWLGESFVFNLGIFPLWLLIGLPIAGVVLGYQAHRKQEKNEELNGDEMWGIILVVTALWPVVLGFIFYHKFLYKFMVEKNETNRSHDANES